MSLLDHDRAAADRPEYPLGDGCMHSLDGTQERFVCVSAGELAERLQL